MASRIWTRRSRIPLIRFVLILLGISLLLVSTQSRWQSWTIDSELATTKSVLWVTAHPDDESFFFAPTITNLVKAPVSTRASLLCLSIGDYEGVGSIRQEELQSSCRVLGIEEARCVAVNHSLLPDNPSVKWPADAVLTFVKRYASVFNTDAIITFDEYGVSGHANHRVLHEILSQAVHDGTLPTPVYSVRSANVIAKYTSLLLLPFAFVKHLLSASLLPSKSSPSLFVSSFDSFSVARASFAAHESQSRWFRTLFINASRYLWYVQVDRVV
ncbi:N-acetylglucosaminylphosphatidylinositol deacetylase [Sporobolomyces salmoneus]|uniref:N-acetylglucosaminylphosphatidylinositol deacetylase n=1 Tax=Sporobolomyces salmoneus TaxID=183962 RepID=UPI00317B029A